MSWDALAGAVYGPVAYRTDGEKVDEIVGAVGDDPIRWRRAVPPSASGALLFAVARLLLADARFPPGAVLHGEQTFTWERPVLRDAALSVSGRVVRVRERGGVAYVVFDVEVADTEGTVLAGTSTFLVGPAPAAGAAEEAELPAEAGSQRTPVSAVGEGRVAGGVRGASRADLVRYAGASRDWNPIHWDHATARAAGLPGVVVHGLLESAWLLVEAASLRRGDLPVAAARFRYRAPLRPGVEARIEGSLTGSALALDLVTADGPVVVATLTLGEAG